MDGLGLRGCQCATVGAAETRGWRGTAPAGAGILCRNQLWLQELQDTVWDFSGHPSKDSDM